MDYPESQDPGQGWPKRRPESARRLGQNQVPARRGGMDAPPGFVVAREGDGPPFLLSRDLFLPDWELLSVKDDPERISIMLLIAYLTMVEQPTKCIECLPGIASGGAKRAKTLESIRAVGRNLRASFEQEWTDWLAWAWANREQVESEPSEPDITLSELEKKTPPLNRDDGSWVLSKLAAELDSRETDTLRSYRHKGLVNTSRTLGRDKDGRIWRREGMEHSHPWYLRSSLKSNKK